MNLAAVHYWRHLKETELYARKYGNFSVFTWVVELVRVTIRAFCWELRRLFHTVFERIFTVLKKGKLSPSWTSQCPSSIFNETMLNE